LTTTSAERKQLVLIVEALAQLAYHQALDLVGVVGKLRRVHGVEVEGLSQRRQRVHATAGEGLVQPPQVQLPAVEWFEP